jgi:hypothetical protein
LSKDLFRLLVLIVVALFLTVMAARANSLVVTNLSSSVTDTSATMIVSCTATNTGGDVAPNEILYVGSTDGGTTAANWGLAIDLGTNAVGVLITNTLYSLREQKDYYWRVTGNSSSGTVWASSSSTFRTLPRGAATASGALKSPGASVTNIAWAASITNYAGAASDAFTSNLVSQLNGWLAGLAPTLSNTVNQVGGINSNLVRRGVLP